MNEEQDQTSSSHQQTLGEAIMAVQKSVDDALDERKRLLKLALDRGASSRTIGAMLGVSHATVYRWSKDKEDPAGSSIDNILAGPVDDPLAKP